jgi:hypothetical protein
MSLVCPEIGRLRLKAWWVSCLFPLKTMGGFMFSYQEAMQFLIASPLVTLAVIDAHGLNSFIFIKVAIVFLI